MAVIIPCDESGSNERAESPAASQPSSPQLQMLDELSLLTDVKLLSTVSGGSFTGLTYAISQSEGQTFDEFYESFSNFLKNTNAIDNALNDLYTTPSPSGMVFIEWDLTAQPNSPLAAKAYGGQKTS